MTTAEMMDLLRQRTKISDASKCLRELRVGYEWAVNEVFKSADGPQLLVTVGEELPALAAVTRDYDLESALSGGALLGLQTLWAKMPTDINFTKLLSRDITNSDFTNLDIAPAANPLIAQGYPVFYAVTNFGQLRFAPALPIGTILRADYAEFGPVPDPTTNPTADTGSDLPWLFHSAIVHQTTALLMLTLDDDRAVAYSGLAGQTLTSAIYAAGKSVRTQAPVQTRPYRRGTRRRGI